MFALTCPHCSTRRLLTPSRVLGVVNDDRGVHALVECTCGGLLVWDAADDHVVAA